MAFAIYVELNTGFVVAKAGLYALDDGPLVTTGVDCTTGTGLGKYAENLVHERAMALGRSQVQSWDTIEFSPR